MMCPKLIGINTTDRAGQSLLEYVGLLALVAVICVTVVAGIGQRSRTRVAQANEALEEAAVASKTPSTGVSKPALGGPGGNPPKN